MHCNSDTFLCQSAVLDQGRCKPLNRGLDDREPCLWIHKITEHLQGWGVHSLSLGNLLQCHSYSKGYLDLINTTAIHTNYLNQILSLEILQFVYKWTCSLQVRKQGCYSCPQSSRWSQQWQHKYSSTDQALADSFQSVLLHPLNTVTGQRKPEIGPPSAMQKIFQFSPSAVLKDCLGLSHKSAVGDRWVKAQSPRNNWYPFS